MKSILTLVVTSLCLGAAQHAAAQAPAFGSNSVIGNQATGNFYIQQAPSGGAGSYVEMINNNSADASRAGSIGYIAGYNAVNPSGTSHTFYTRTGGGGWVSQLRITQDGKVQIGAQMPQSQPDYRLCVDGKIVAQSLYITNPSGWADYVFEPSYVRMPLKEVKSYVARYKHLPEVPTTADVQQNGVDLTAMNVLLLKKLEELTLHLIEATERIEKLEATQAIK
ncbi:hypothetical protein E5K00_21685 [Hymenobacter aquaticus]|uniref:Tail fiber domain-containing protein n=1 Tax=Hymenobacter aquaticus TaxID=1867101 RepID=A0A4Z0PTH6_9BACT|nr:hypothetical protein [Hymenobacter aquaticus]TGE20609.1 hypothetical protein E5K00_21685 [Hymenobacter aquaticus]